LSEAYRGNHTIDIDRDFAREAFGHTAKVQEGYDHPDTDELFHQLAGARDILKKRLGEDIAIIDCNGGIYGYRSIGLSASIMYAFILLFPIV
jgi:hypothetical protein